MTAVLRCFSRSSISFFRDFREFLMLSRWHWEICDDPTSSTSFWICQ